MDRVGVRVEPFSTYLERAARLGLAGAMITKLPLEHQRSDQPEYGPFWTATEALAMSGGNIARVYCFDVARLTPQSAERQRT
jgi:hypothetical protein